MQTISEVEALINAVVSEIGESMYGIRKGKLYVSYVPDLDVFMEVQGGPIVMARISIGPDRPKDFYREIHDLFKSFDRLYHPVEIIPYSYVKDTNEMRAKWKRDHRDFNKEYLLEDFRLISKTTFITRVTLIDRVTHTKIIEEGSEPQEVLYKRAHRKLTALVRGVNVNEDDGE